MWSLWKGSVLTASRLRSEMKVRRCNAANILTHNSPASRMDACIAKGCYLWHMDPCMTLTRVWDKGLIWEGRRLTHVRDAAAYPEASVAVKSCGSQNVQAVRKQYCCCRRREQLSWDSQVCTACGEVKVFSFYHRPTVSLLPSDSRLCPTSLIRGRESRRLHLVPMEIRVCVSNLLFAKQCNICIELLATELELTVR